MTAGPASRVPALSVRSAVDGSVALFADHVPAIGTARNASRSNLRVVREERPAVFSDDALEQGFLLIDQQFGIAVVAHRDRQVHPRGAWNKVAEKRVPPVARSFDTREHEAGRVAFRIGEGVRIAQYRAAVALDDLQAPGCFEQPL